jgi:membrane protease YdiL (CAAX protease family)
MSLSGSFRESFIQMPVSLKMILLVFVILIFAIVGTILTFACAIPLFNKESDEIFHIIANPDSGNIYVLKYFQIGQTVLWFLLPAVAFAWLVSENGYHYLRLNRNISVITLVLVFLLAGASTQLMNAVLQLNSKLDLPLWLDTIERKMVLQEEAAGRLTELFLASNTYSSLMFNFAMIAILPALAEEFLFRGVLQRLMCDWTKNEHAGIIISAFIFSFIHFQFFGFLPRFMLGIYFGYLLLWSGSLWVPIAAHLINNGMAVIYYHFSTDNKLDTIGTSGDSNYMFYISVFITCTLIGLIYMHEKSRKLT